MNEVSYVSTIGPYEIHRLGPLYCIEHVGCFDSLQEAEDAAKARINAPGDDTHSGIDAP